MNTARSIKIIKKAARREHDAPVAVQLTVDPNSCSKAVRSWVFEFQERDRIPDSSELPAFDSLFKDAVTLPGTD